jgi:hypothetical protein
VFHEPKYQVGNVVQLRRGGEAYTVIWHGQLLVQYPGGWFREWVYRLDNNFWDCYHEAELYLAWRQKNRQE